MEGECISATSDEYLEKTTFKSFILKNKSPTIIIYEATLKCEVSESDDSRSLGWDQSKTLDWNAEQELHWFISYNAVDAISGWLPRLIEKNARHFIQSMVSCFLPPINVCSYQFGNSGLLFLPIWRKPWEIEIDELDIDVYKTFFKSQCCNIDQVL